MSRKNAVAIPGQEPINPAETQSNPDEAVEYGRSGKARPIRTLRVPVAPAITDRPDPSRPATAFVNSAEHDMDMADAIDLDNQGKLQKSVLTEQGWYCPLNTEVQRIERRKNGKPDLVEIAQQVPVEG